MTLTFLPFSTTLSVRHTEGTTPVSELRGELRRVRTSALKWGVGDLLSDTSFLPLSEAGFTCPLLSWYVSMSDRNFLDSR